MSHLRHAYNQETDDDEDDDSFGSSSPADRIRRHYHHHQPTGSQVSSQQTGSSSLTPAGEAGGICAPETIQVKLNESYFARERRLVLDGLANVRQKVGSLRMFNPAKNESVMQQAQQEWNEKEKYTLDSLNEFRSGGQQKLQNGRQHNARDWTHPQDGREIWPSKLQYFLAITSYSIGLGNVIRFPILVQKNGGLAFIIPFVIMLLLEGIPLFYLELAIGQRMRKAAVSCWSLVSPFAAGIGLASAAVSFLIGLYYNTMVAWTLIYAWTALTNKLPRAADEQQCSDESQQNKTTSSNVDECQLSSAYEFQWYRETLNVTGEVGDWSHFNWPVALCLTLAWLISYLCLVRGLSSSKRLVYTISIFPYVILLVFLFKSLQLDGWQHGVRYLFAPDWPKLLDPFVWLQAAAQVFFSLGLGFGGLIALSSYNSINNNCYRDAVKVSLINFATSLLAGVVIFSILGFRAQLNHSKCQLERDQQINFYLADYNLKVLDHGAVFKQVHSEDERRRIARSLDKLLSGGGGEQTSARPPTKKKTSKKASMKKESERQEVTQFVATRVEQNDTSDKFDSSSIANSNNENDDDDDEFSAADAIYSITNLDRQLDLGSNSGSFDYGDADSEFVLNASALISNSQLEQIIEGIKGLPKCSIERELDESTRGTGLVFVVIAEAISQFDSIPTPEDLTRKVNPFHLSASTWAILFFLMILALGFDSQFGNLEGLLSSLTDLNYFNLNKRAAATAADDRTNGHEGTHEPNGLHLDHDTPPEVGTVDSGIVAVRRWATGVICLSSLVVSLVFFAHGAGAYMFAIFDEYASNFSLILIALFELLTISYIYPLGRFTNDCELMTGKRPHFLILLSWRYISPILLLVVLMTTIKQFTMELDYEVWSTTTSLEQHLSEKPWPTWAILFGSLLIVCCVIWIPLVAMLKILLKVTLVPEEQARQWFPAEELKEYHQMSDSDGHQVTRLERILFGFADDYD